jgi:membrane-associated phospholipid phosphatase
MKIQPLCQVILVIALVPGTAMAAQNAFGNPSGGCGEIIGRVPHDIVDFGHGLAQAPRNAIRLSNLKWELPIAAATASLIAWGDQPFNQRIHSASFERDAVRGSDIGIGIELATAGLMYGIGCSGHRSPYAANTGWVALEAMGAANGVNLGIKALTNRQYAYQQNSQGEFWEGGKSFSSGHAATSFAFAAVIAHRYPDKRWLKWTAYGLATAVSLSRLAGKKHFPSDILVGGTIGYVTGTYFAEHSF